MSTEEVKAAPRTVQYKQRLTTFRDSRRGKMFGVAEVAALAGSCLVLLLVLFSYLYFLVPARSRVSSLNEDKTRLQANLKTLGGVVDKEKTTKDQVDHIAASLTGFESSYLPRADQGKLELYNELNQLIVKNGLRNTSGPTYTSLEPSGTKSVGGRTTTTKWQSFYPGIAVLVTVEGPYQDIRRFVRDLERSKQFVVINQVELQRANENSGPVSAEGGEGATPAAGSGGRGSLISLQLNLATYFQRESAAGNGQPQE
ncbi:MAG TPA: GspMb/PilO family protein [Pyrinomonadaceae bacterium]|jgi:Tfp pilus assembly protein PilO|nr:GspMb/PilO family protein [Pyrinomonadaceae bacterium]